MDVFGADLGAALGDVAHPDPGLVPEQGPPVLDVLGVHLQGGDPDHEARPVEGVLAVVVAEDVADVLTEEALDALAELDRAVDVLLGHVPGLLGGGVECRRRELRDPLVDLVVPGDVGHQVLDVGKRVHWPDRDLLALVGREARLAHQAWEPVDLGRAGSALGGLAVPADRQVAVDMALHPEHGVEHDHAFLDRDVVADHLPTRLVAAPDVEPQRPDRLDGAGVDRLQILVLGDGGLGRHQSSLV